MKNVLLGMISIGLVGLLTSAIQAQGCYRGYSSSYYPSHAYSSSSLRYPSSVGFYYNQRNPGYSSSYSNYAYLNSLSYASRSYVYRNPYSYGSLHSHSHLHGLGHGHGHHGHGHHGHGHGHGHHGHGHHGHGGHGHSGFHLNIRF